GVKRDELLAAASEVGIPAADIDAAIRELEAEKRGEVARGEIDEDEAARWRRQVRNFARHFGIYLVVIGALYVMNLMTTPDYWWFLWPALGWGIGIGSHAVAVLFPGESKRERRERRRRRDRDRGGVRVDASAQTQARIADDGREDEADDEP